MAPGRVGTSGDLAGGDGVNGVETMVAIMWCSLLALFGWLFYVVRTYGKD